MEERAAERARAVQGQANPVPLLKHIKAAGMHWLEAFDSDGHAGGLEVFQWQPGVQKWCRPNHYATPGNEVNMSRYVYVGPCMLPVEPADRERLKAMIQELDGSEQISATCHSKYLRIGRDNYQFLRDLLHSMV